MKSILCFTAAMVAVTSLQAQDQGVQIRQRAQAVSGQVTERNMQGMPPGSRYNPNPAAIPAPNPAPPADPAISALQQNISNIATDLEGLQTDPAKKQALINDLNLAAVGTSPSKASVGKLAGDLAGLVSAKSLSPEQRTRMAQYLRAIFNSSHLAPSQQQMVLSQTQKILQAAGVSSEMTAGIVSDFKAIAAETK